MTASRPAPILIALLALFAALYCLQVASPLRINTDSYRFLSMALSASEGHGYLVDGKPDVYPEGYPFLLTLLIRAGLGSTPWINALGIASILLAMSALHQTLAADAALLPLRPLFILLPLASWVWIKHATIPLSENPYCALSFAALFALVRSWTARGWKAAAWLILGFLLSLAAWRVRSVGISLLAAAAFTAVARPGTLEIWRPWLPRSGPARLLSAVVAILLIALAAALFIHLKSKAGDSGGRPNYLLQQQEQGGGRSLPAFLAFTVGTHAIELGGLAVNLPALRFPSFNPLFLLTGALALAVCAAGLPRLARRFPALAIYAAAYSAIILIWPFPDARFWMPILPILFLSAWYALSPWTQNPILRRALLLYVAIFLTLGLAALCLSTRVSLAGARFSDLYGDGTDRNTYRFAFGVANEPAPDVNMRHVELLKRLEPLAQRAASR